jgi:hypothetical protein
MAEPPKRPTARPHLGMDSANFPTFKVNVPAPTKSAAAAPPKAQAQAPVAKPKGGT